MIKRPLHHLVEIPANVLRVELRPRQRVAGDHVESKDADICVALRV